MNRYLSARSVRCGAVVAAFVMVSACAASGTAHLSTFHPAARDTSTIKADKYSILHPKHKYFGIYLPSAPANTSGIDKVKTETGKQPNMDLYFDSWGPGAINGSVNFNTKTAENACGMGMLPLYTWESWNTLTKGTNPNGQPGVLWAQKNFAPAKIVAGDYDTYIRREAIAMSKVSCPIALRFDQEVNGYWYPWGVTTKGMPGTVTSRAKEYRLMWRHVWRIFHNQHANNVVWVWSPNFQKANQRGYPQLSAEYPGDAYVDWVGIDGYYYNNPTQTFKGLFGPTMAQLKVAAPHKPWMIAETGVGTYSNPKTKPAQITDLLKNVANHPRFNGFVYFDQFKPYDRSDWKFDDNQASLKAFKAGISNPVYASGKPGSL